MKRCGHCQTRIVFGGLRVGGQRFCGQSCANKVFPPAPLVFCPQCVAETTTQSPGDLWSLNGWGTTLLMDRSLPACEECGSLGGRVWITVFFLPVIPLSQYRVLFKWRDWMSSKFL